MNGITSCKHVFSISLVCLLLSLTSVQAQHDKKSSPPPARPSAPHASAPQQHSNVSRPAPNTHAPNVNNRPGTPMNNHPGTPMNNHPGTSMNNHPGAPMNNRPNTNPNMGRPGTAMNGRNGSNSPMNHPNGAGGMNNNMRGPSGDMANGRMAAHPNVNRPLPGRQVSLRGGGQAVIRPNGQIRTINRNGMQINRGMHGQRTIVSTHNGARIVTTGRHAGYVQRNYVTRGGRTYVSRTVVVNHVTYTHVYRSYSYHGYCCYYGYHPAYYYAPAYYGWAYHPWATPVYYGWGWAGNPWYGYYGGYFAPYPVYPSAAFWLTDYLIAANLRAAYEARAAANAAAVGDDNGGGNNGGGNNGGGGDQQYQNSGNDNSATNSGPVTLTPEVKDAIAEEVRAQLAAQQAAAQQGSADNAAQSTQSNATEEVPAALDPARHTFIVASDLTVSSDGQECQLTPGDVIKRTSDTPDDDRKVTATVSSSKKSDCAAGQEIAIGVDDLQEMHNKFEEQLDNGMKELSNKQGQNGLPKAPETKTTPSDVPEPAPDASAAKALEEQQSAADQTESQVVKEAFSQGS